MSKIESVIMTTSSLRFEAFANALSTPVHHGRTSVEETKIKPYFHDPLDCAPFMSRWKSIHETAGAGTLAERWLSQLTKTFNNGHSPAFEEVETYHGDSVQMVMGKNDVVHVLEKPKSSSVDDIVEMAMTQSGCNIAIASGITRTVFREGRLARRTVGILSTLKMRSYDRGDVVEFMDKVGVAELTQKSGGVSFLTEHAFDLYDPCWHSYTFIYTRKKMMQVGSPMFVGDFTSGDKLKAIYGTAPEAISFLRSGEMPKSGVIYQFKLK